MTSGSVTFTFPSFDDIVRVPREDGGVDIMLNGVVFDSIEPVKRVATDEENRAFLEAHRQLVERISEQIGERPVDAVELVREQRRNLTPDEWVPPDYRGKP